MVIKNDKYSYAAVLDAIRAAQRRISELNDINDLERLMQINDLLDAAAWDVDALAYINHVGTPHIVVDGEEYSLHVSAPSRSDLILDQLGECRGTE